MSRHAMVITVLGVSSVAAVALAALALPLEFRTASNNSFEAVRQGWGAGAICSVPDAPEPTFYSELAKVNARMHEGMEIVPSGNVDHDFMRIMIPHHQGAIDMALVLLKYGRDERIKRLAQSIIVEQGQEITYMRSLLGTSPGEIPNTHRMSHE
jgi:uncharacterized protein (DUF305 family)